MTNTGISLDINSLIRGLKRVKSGVEDLVSVCPMIEKSQVGGVIFFKPEVCHVDGPILERVLSYFLFMSHRYRVCIQGAYAVSGHLLHLTRVMEHCYEAIHKNAQVFGHEKRPARTGKYDSLWGSLALLKRGYTSTDLMQVWQTAKNVIKIDEDFYGIDFEIQKKKGLLINGFYPYQLTQFYKNNNKIMLFFFNTHTPFSYLKEHYQGTANIDKQVPWSIRYFLRHHQRWFLPTLLCTSQNGFHLSASPDEGEREAKLFLNFINQHARKEGL